MLTDEKKGRQFFNISASVRGYLDACQPFKTSFAVLRGERVGECLGAQAVHDVQYRFDVGVH